MVSLSKICGWIRSYAVRYAHLESRVSDLERQLNEGILDKCPSCGKRTYSAILSNTLTRFVDVLGIVSEPYATRLTYVCRKCGFTEEKISKI